MLRLSSRADSHGNRASSLRARDPHGDCDSGAFAYGRRDTESLTNSLGHRYPHPYSDRFSHTHVNSDTITHTHPDPNSYPYADRYANADAHCDRNADADPVAYPDADPCSAAQPDGGANAYAHSDPGTDTGPATDGKPDALHASGLGQPAGGSEPARSPGQH